MSPAAKSAIRSAIVASLIIIQPAKLVAEEKTSSLGFSISVDGVHVAGDLPSDADAAAITGSVAAAVPIPGNRPPLPTPSLDSVALEMRYDGPDVEPVLATRIRLGSGQNFAALEALTNYPEWIAHAEYRFIGGGSAPRLIGTLPANLNQPTLWQLPENLDEDTMVVLRVYGRDGRFDETAPQPLVGSAEAKSDPSVIRGIDIFGGGVTIRATGLDDRFSLDAFGEQIRPTGGTLEVQRILPPGDHALSARVMAPDGKSVTFDQDINIPANEWFYVGLADLTLGQRLGSGTIEPAQPGAFGNTYSKGRLAFYLKGKIKGRTLLTASADTGEDSLDNLFRNLDSKDPRQVLRRIDPDTYYPVYGDGSTSVDDAPTSGKFYVRIERGDNHVMWGNFRTSIGTTRLLPHARALYGAHAKVSTEARTETGDARFSATTYAAQPDTLPQHDLFNATGGSAYVLKRQDISIGSESVAILISDPVTGRVLERIPLKADEDYTLNAAQGIVILARPLSSVMASRNPVRDGAFGRTAVSLSVSYEYSPALGQTDGYSLGGRMEGWLDDHVRLGATGHSEETGPANQQMAGIDLMLRHSETTKLELETAWSTGPGFGHSRSTDGGLTIHDVMTAGRINRTGRAFSAHADLDLGDVDERLNGRMAAYAEHKTAGFATQDSNIATDQTSWGASLEMNPDEKFGFKLSHDAFASADGAERSDSAGSVSLAYDSRWLVETGATLSRQRSADRLTDGERIDGGLRITYQASETTKIHGFAQGSLATRGTIKRNDRIGIGATAKLTKTIGVDAEVSTGTGGLGATVALTHDPAPGKQRYLGYTLDPARLSGGSRGTDRGRLVSGIRQSYGDTLEMHLENSVDLPGSKQERTTNLGVNWSPDDAWTWGGSYETGQILDPDAADFERHAISASVAYSDDDRFSARLRGEARFETSEDGTRNRDTYLMVGGVTMALSDDWKFIGNGEGLVSVSDQSSFRNGRYAKADAGFAWRPTRHDRFNALFKYTWLYDLPGEDQVNKQGELSGPAQLSHVLNVDGTYDLNRYLSVGAKYGFRIGEAQTVRDGPFTASTAHLGILRADFHVVEKWDALVEGRVLHLSEARQTDWGALAAIYRHVGKHAKVGVGYNFGRFSDDLTDLVQDDGGWFLNVVGKF